MKAVFRPGPSSIPPVQAPGGLVVHIYDRQGVRLCERKLRPGDPIEELVQADVAETIRQTTGPVAIVCYDGDNGARWPVEEIAAAMLSGADMETKH